MRVLGMDGTVCNVPEEDILFFNIYEKTIYVHTRDAEFIFPTSLEHVQAVYQDASFDRVDRSYIVRMDKVKGFHEERQSVYFEEHPLKDTKFVPVSEKNVKRVTEYLRSRMLK